MLIKPHVFSGNITIPASKSHTIRRLLLASLTQGVSHIERPLDSLDSQSCMAACRVLGAKITEEQDGKGGLSDRLLARWIVEGHKPGAAAVSASSTTPLLIDVGNSGTTLFLALAAAALGSVPVTFTGDRQIARRSATPLLDALAGLGITVTSSQGIDGNMGYTPITVCGPWKGGRVSISCPTSQYLSALLIAAPLAPAGTITEIDIPLLNEKPYIEMTLSYLKKLGIYGETGASANTAIASINSTEDFSRFVIRGGGVYTPINGPVPGDFSSAAFPAAAAIISGGALTLLGLDPHDTQGDKVFFEYIERMGCDVRWESCQDGCRLTVSRSGPLKGGIFDLNAAPDLLPVMAVLGAYAQGETALVNAAHARIKETDRIAVMAMELNKLFAGKSGYSCEERPDGLIIQGMGAKIPAGGNAVGDNTSNSNIEEKPPIKLEGHGDHRIVMALACAALGSSGPVEIAGAEAADVTYPGFLDLLKNICY